MIPDFFILIVGAVFLALAAFQFYAFLRIRNLDAEIKSLAAVVLKIARGEDKPEESTGAVN